MSHALVDKHKMHLMMIRLYVRNGRNIVFNHLAEQLFVRYDVSEKDLYQPPFPFESLENVSGHW